MVRDFPRRNRKDKSPDYSEIPTDEETPSVVSDDQPPAFPIRFTGYRALAPKVTPCTETSPDHAVNRTLAVDSPNRFSRPASQADFIRANLITSNQTFTRGSKSSSYAQAVESPRLAEQSYGEFPSEYDVAYPSGTYQPGKRRRWLAPPRRRVRYLGDPGNGKVNLVDPRDYHSHARERPMIVGPPTKPMALHPALTEQQRNSPLLDIHSPYRTYLTRISSPDSAIHIYHHEGSPKSPEGDDPTKGTLWSAASVTTQGSPLPWTKLINKRRVLSAASYDSKQEPEIPKSAHRVIARERSSSEETLLVDQSDRLRPPCRLNPIQPITRPHPPPPILPSLSAVIEQNCRARVSPFKGAVKYRRPWPGVPSRIIPGLQIQLPTHSPRTPTLPIPYSNHTVKKEEEEAAAYGLVKMWHVLPNSVDPSSLRELTQTFRETGQANGSGLGVCPYRATSSPKSMGWPSIPSIAIDKPLLKAQSDGLLPPLSYLFPNYHWSQSLRYTDSRPLTLEPVASTLDPNPLALAPLDSVTQAKLPIR
ncbi:hypothetical protein IWQ61_005800 [Dispira simplex]|nr:hypothetical protein IWQ61_005800 [Dispira simplex]